MQVRDDRLLAGEGDVQPVEAHPLGGGQQLGQRLGAETQHLQVDAAVDVAQAQGGTFLLVHGRGQRRLDAIADQTDEQTFRWHGHLVPVPSSAAWARLLIADICLPTFSLP